MHTKHTRTHTFIHTRNTLQHCQRPPRRLYGSPRQVWAAASGLEGCVCTPEAGGQRFAGHGRPGQRILPAGIKFCVCVCVLCVCRCVLCVCVCVCERVEPLALYVYFAATRRALTVMQPCASGQKKAVVGRRLIPM
jgi:hypothetical protein